jgi:hypothetical protein
MPTLTELSSEVFDLERQLDQAEGDEAQQEVIAAYLESTQEAVELKLDRYATFIRELESRAEYRNAEAKRLAHLGKGDLDKVEFLKCRLKHYFQSHELSKMETPHFRLSLVQNSGKTPVQVLVPAEDLPEGFRSQATIYKADLDAIRASIEGGNAVPGAILREKEQTIRIK